MGKKTLMKGNHAIAEAAVRAGCKFFAGYPITPQSELLEYMSWRLPEAGGYFRQTESEIGGISMVLGAGACGFRAMTASSGPGYSLMQECISYMASDEIPGVIVDVTRYASGIGDINPAQGDWFQLSRNGGHGDYRTVVFAPGSPQEAVDAMPLAFETAEKYRMPVIVAVDGSIGTMVEAVELPEGIQNPDPNRFPWAIKDRHEGEKKSFKPRFYRDFVLHTYEEELRSEYAAIADAEQRWSSFMLEDAELVMVAYGTMSRACRAAVIKARGQGLKLGLIQIKTIWPFPKRAFTGIRPKGFLAVEMSIITQMGEDVALAARGIAPAYTWPTGGVYPSIDTIIGKCVDALNGKVKEV